MRQMIVQPSLNGLTLRDVKRVERHVESLGALFDLIPLGSVSLPGSFTKMDGKFFATMEQTLMRRLSKMGLSNPPFDNHYTAASIYRLYSYVREQEQFRMTIQTWVDELAQIDIVLPSVSGNCLVGSYATLKRRCRNNRTCTLKFNNWIQKQTLYT